MRPFYYYWNFFTQSGVWTIPAFIGLLYPYLKDRVFDKKGYLFTLLWTLVSVVLLSVIPEKKSRYLLPVLIPLALNTAFYIEYLFRRFSEIKNRRETWPVYFNFGLIASIGLVFPLAGYFLLKDSLAGRWLWFVLLSISLLGIGLLLFKHLFRRNIRAVFYLTIAFIVAVICFGMPMAKALTVNPDYKGFSQLRSWQEEENLTVYEYSFVTPELVWDYGGKLPVLQKEGSIKLPDETRFGVLVTEEERTSFELTFSHYTLRKVTRYDMNAKGKEDASHKTRLWRDLYLVTKPK